MLLATFRISVAFGQVREKIWDWRTASEKFVVTLQPNLETYVLTVEKFGCLQPLEKMLKLR